jgi:hypothetical protein
MNLLAAKCLLSAASWLPAGWAPTLAERDGEFAVCVTNGVDVELVPLTLAPELAASYWLLVCARAWQTHRRAADGDALLAAIEAIPDAAKGAR